MTDTDQEQFVSLVADHVVSAIERMIGERLEPEERRHHVTGALMGVMLAAMPTTAGWVLAEACNRYLSGRPYQGFELPRVADVDMGDGSVTMSPTV